MTHSIVVYTTPGCPDCAAVKRWLNQHGCTYMEKDVSRPDVADEAKRRYGVRIAPITVIDDQFFYGTFDQQRERLAAALDITD